MRKRLLVMITALVMLISCVALVGCNKNTPPSDTTPSIELPSDTLELYTGQTALIKPVVKNTSAMLMWQSSKSDVAGVDQSGLVTAYRAGTAVITVFNSDTSSEMTVTIVDPEADASISFDVQQLGVTLYDYIVLTPTVIKLDGDIAWRSSDESVLTVDGGVITQKSLGTADVIASIGGLSAKVTITVGETNKVPTVNYGRDRIDLLVGGELKIEPQVSFNGVSVRGFTTEYTSRNTDIVTVSADGTVQGKRSGSALIAVEAEYRGYDFAIYEIPVTVKADAEVALSSNTVEIYTRAFADLGYAKTQEITTAVQENGVSKPSAQIVWSSKDSAVATVDNGMITAVGAGETIVSATYTTESGDSVTTDVNVSVTRPVITVNEKSVRDLSKTDVAVEFNIPDDFSDLALDNIKIENRTIDASFSNNIVQVDKNLLGDFSGELDVFAEFRDVVYKFPSLIITKSVDDMDDLREIAAAANGKEVFDGYYVLNKDVTANNADDFILTNVVWSNDATKGFIGTFDGQGHGIYNLNIGADGLFMCVGGTGIVRNLALVNATGKGYAVATECRGTVDNIFVTSDTKSALIQMSDEAVLKNGFSVLSADGSSVVSTIYSSTCKLNNFYALADRMIGYTQFSQGSEPTIAAKPSVAALRSELTSLDFNSSGYDKQYWDVKGGTPVYKSYIPNMDRLTITSPDEIICSSGQSVEIKANSYISVSLKSAVDGLSVNDVRITADKTASATVVATDLYGNNAEKDIVFTVVTFVDRTATHLFDYELGSGDLTFALPNGVSAPSRISFGDGVYYSQADGFSVSSGKVTVNSELVRQSVDKYGDVTVTLSCGEDYIGYSSSFVTKIIENYDDLNSIPRVGEVSVLDGYYILANDFTADNATPFVSLCGYSNDPAKGFIGIFDGRGHTISKLNIEVSMFGAVGIGGVIKNFALIDSTSQTAYGTSRVLADELHAGTFENIFVHSDAKRLFATAWHTFSLKNVMFVTSDPEFGLFNEGASGTMTLDGVAVVSTQANGYVYYGGTELKNHVSVYTDISAMFAALESDNKLATWTDSMIEYDNGQIKFNGKLVLDNSYHAHNYNLQVAEDKYLASAADCENKAVYYMSCKCGEAGTQTFENGDPLGHSAEHHEAVTASSCDQESNYEYWYCSRCKKYSRTADFTVKLDRTDIFYTSDHNFTAITVTAPQKTVYDLGDAFDTTGLAVTAHCSKCNNDVALKADEYTVTDKTLAKGANEFTVTYGTFTGKFTVYVYDRKDLTDKGSVADFVYNASASEYSARLKEVSGVVAKVKIEDNIYDGGVAHSDGTLTVPSSAINALLGSNTYGDFEIDLVTAAYDVIKVKIAVVTSIINSVDELNALWNTVGGVAPTADNEMKGYYILGADISDATINALYGWCGGNGYGFAGIFDGRGHRIEKTTFVSSMFGYVSTKGIVRNLALVDVHSSDGGILTFECVGGEYQNIFISTDNQFAFSGMFPRSDVVFANFMFVTSSAADNKKGLFNEGNNTNGGNIISCDVVVIGSNTDNGYEYFGGTHTKLPGYRYDVFVSTDEMLSALATENIIAEWQDNALISYADGAILFNGAEVLRKQA